jgi:hypothetical protein
MNSTDASRKTVRPAVSHLLTDARMRLLWLTLARIVSVGLIVLFVGCFIVTVPLYFTRLHTLCSSPSCLLGQLTPAALRTLQTLGLPLESYATFIFTLGLVTALVGIGVATTLVLRAFDNWMALLVALLLTVQGTGPGGSPFLLDPVLGPTLAAAVASLQNFVDAACLIGVFFLFPDGRFVPRWSRWLMLFLLIADVYFSFLGSASSGPAALIFLGGVLWFSFVIGGIVAQVYRYLRVSTAVQRQQTKWVVYSLAVTLLLAVLGLFLPSLLFPALGQPDSLYNIVGTLLLGNLTLVLFLALSLGVAILRYRLYDIDLLIRRTLVYGTLTVMLGLVYFGLIIGLQSLVRVLTGTIAEQPLVIVASTLTIAALFQPLRSRLQGIIDLRFYRRKYDAARTIAAFSATLRQEVDLDQLREQLLAVVQETMQPAHVSLWVRPSAHDGTQRAPWRATSPVSSEGK